MWTAGSLAAVGSVALALSLFAGSASAVNQPNRDSPDRFDLSQLMSPSLGSTYDGIGGGWSGRLYRHPRLWVGITGGAREGDGFVRSRSSQFQIGNVTATSTISGMMLYGLVSSGDRGHPKIIGSATAIGNWSDVAICLSPACGGDPTAISGDPEPAQENAGRPGITAISIIDGSTGEVTQEVTDTRATPQDPAATAEEDELATEEAVVEEQPAEENGGFDIHLAMVPNIGSGIGPQDWWFPGLGGVNVYISPEVLVLNRVLVERHQLVAGDVVATSTANSIEIEEAVTDQIAAGELVDGEAVQPDLPDIVLSAVALGNATSINSDSGGLAIGRQIVIGSVDEFAQLPMLGGGGIAQASQGGSMSGALLAMMADGWISKADIKAEASAEHFAEALSHVSATALANKYTVNGHAGLASGNLLMTDLVQIAYADMTAKVVEGPRKISGGVEFSAVATAVGNISEISLAHAFD